MISKLYKNKKQGFFIIVLISFVLITLCLIRFATPEDYWYCSSGAWAKHGHPKASTPNAICPPPNSKLLTAGQVVENFYNWFFRIDGNPISNGYLKTNDLLTKNFKNNADYSFRASKLVNFNPFICNHTESPISFSAQEIYNKNNRALVMVYQSYISSQDRLEVSLIKSNGFWYIDSINCAKSFDSIQSFDLTPKKIVPSDQYLLYYPNLRMNSASKDCTQVLATSRKTKTAKPQMKEVLTQLFAGPTDDEKKQGYTSWFSAKTKNILKDAIVKDGVAYLNFTDFRELLPNVSSACGYGQFNASILQTLSSSFNINKAIYSINSNTKTFYDWVQQSSP